LRLRVASEREAVTLGFVVSVDIGVTMRYFARRGRER
jgi:hypothetical protein